MTKYFYYYYTITWDQPQPHTKYNIYAVGELDTSTIRTIKNDDTYDLEFIPTRVIASNLMPKDWKTELSMSASQMKNWTFDTLEDAERFCIREIF
jgi:hypothetical protein